MQGVPFINKTLCEQGEEGGLMQHLFQNRIIFMGGPVNDGVRAGLPLPMLCALAATLQNIYLSDLPPAPPDGSNGVLRIDGTRVG